MFSKVAILSVFVSLVAGAALDVWAPPITSPTAASVWPIGSTQNVTWDTSNKPAQVTNPNGLLVLSKDGLLDDGRSNPLAANFPLTQGWVLVTVPEVTPGNDYAVVLIGDSGNDSPQFSIIA
ncbi:hypothetical protein NM688_g5749 [Phlebia brevispora]|uniref:Uncharacterized protein n=1 Tax=Phlebia brevispora TaxID=194682 RepID=A0ACC1SQ95_9APHY|nr:hypothetical protein NM688_g5749 [Phlebia brevispora]